MSKEQGYEFSRLFPTKSWQLFKNFLPTNSTIAKKNSKKKILLFVGRFVPEKGIYEVLKAFEQLLSLNIRQGNNLVLWFVGDGPEIRKLQKGIEKHDPFSVCILGEVGSRKLDEIYSKSFVLLLPSYKEAFPYVVIEAMRAGLPLIVTPTGILPDLIKQGQNGFIVPPRDSKAIANAVCSLLDDALLYNRMCKNSYSCFRRYYSRNAAETYYQKLLDESFD